MIRKLGRFRVAVSMVALIVGRAWAELRADVEDLS
jgi:hypothetical protein